MPSTSRRASRRTSNLLAAACSPPVWHTSVVIQKLEPRLFAGGMVSFAAGAAVIASPSTAAIVVDAAVGSRHETEGDRLRRAPELPDLQSPSPEADPLSSAGDPLPAALTDSRTTTTTATTGGTKKPGGGTMSTTSTGSELLLYYEVHALDDTGNVSEATAPEEGLGAPGHFRFSVWPNCSSSGFPTQVTAQWTLGGSASQVEDYEGPLLDLSVDIPLSGGWGEVDIPYFPRDEWLDENSVETVEVTFRGLTIPDDQPQVPVQPLHTFDTGVVRSGDYTVKTFIENTDRDGNDVFTADNFMEIDHPPYRDAQALVWADARSMGVQVLDDGVKQPGVEVELVLTDDHGAGHAGIEDDTTNPATYGSDLTRTTGSDGTAYFRIKSFEVGSVTFTAYVTNKEGRHQLKDFKVGIH